MKNKDIKIIRQEIEKSISKSLEEYSKSQKSYGKVPSEKKYEDEFRISDYDKTVSDKFKTLVLNMTDYCENLNIYVSEDVISINTDNIKEIKNTNYTKSNTARLINDESFVEIRITKDIFSISTGNYKRSTYKDSEMYDFFIPIMKKKLLEINSETFNEIWEDIMMKSGMIRDNNLDNLFG